MHMHYKLSVYEHMSVCVYELDSGESTGTPRTVVEGLMNVEITVDTEWLLAFGTGVCLKGKRGGKREGGEGREGRKGDEREGSEKGRARKGRNGTGDRR